MHLLGKDCDRALTDEVLEGAKKWMKNAPIDTFIEKPNCFIKKELV